MNSELQFDASSHTYTRAGRTLPSVTTVLDDQLREMDGIPEHLVKTAGEFGQHVHQACNLFNRGQLDWKSLDPKLEPYIRAFKKFRVDTSVRILASEQRVHHPTLGYAGTLDILGLLPLRSRPTVFDVKSSEVLPRSVGAQTAAYREAKVASGQAIDPTRYAVHLKSDGTYELKKLTSPADWNLFLSCLNVYKFRRKL